MGQSDNSIISSRIITNMSEGVITIDTSGVILSVNPAAEQIIERDASDLIGMTFAASFFEYSENDQFTQLVLDAIYDPDRVKQGFVPYFTGEVTKQLRLITSLIKEDDRVVSIIVVLSDMSELFELRDAIKAMERIQALNTQLEARNEILYKTFGRFLTDDIVKAILETPDGLMMGGKKIELSVMMSDLRGFTALSERMDAHDLLSMLNHYLGEMTEIIERNKGTIIEFIGDGIMVIFGAPEYFPDNASRAVACAVEMQKRMKDVNDWNEKNGYPRLNMGIGLNYGEAVVGNIGSEQRTKYGVTGKEINICGRIESFTVGGELLISESIKDRVPEELEIEEVRQVVPKGAKVPMNVYKVVGIGAPYNVTCKISESETRDLAEPVDVMFYTVAEKNISVEEIPAKIISIGDEDAVIMTAAELHRYDNIVINLKGDLYAKVTAVLDNGYHIHFTSIPEGFAEYSKGLKLK